VRGALRLQHGRLVGHLRLQPLRRLGKRLWNIDLITGKRGLLQLLKTWVVLGLRSNLFARHRVPQGRLVTGNR